MKTSPARRSGLALVLAALVVLTAAPAHGEYGWFTWDFWTEGGSTSGTCGPDPFADGGSFCSGNLCLGGTCFQFDCTSCHAAPREALAARYDAPQKTRHQATVFPRMALSCRGCHAVEDIVARLWPKYDDAYARSHHAMVLARHTYRFKDGERLSLNDGSELVRAGGRLRIAHRLAGMETVLPANAVVVKNREGNPMQVFWRLRQPPGVPEKKPQ